jgi:hypothetical protein
MNKINVFRIIKCHFETLRDHSTGKLSWADVAFFFLLPLAAALIGWHYGWGLYVDALNALIGAFTIFAGLLLNLLILIYTFSAATSHSNVLARTKTRFVKELHDNIAFSVLVSISIVIATLVGVAQLKMKDPQNPVHTGPILTFILIYLTANFVLTLLMILKRIHILLSIEIEQPSMRKAS